MKANLHKYRPLFKPTVNLQTEAAHKNFFRGRATLVHALKAQCNLNHNVKLGKHYIV